MSARNILIIIIAAAIGLAYLNKLRSYDIYEKEPWFTLLAVTLFGGITAIITSLFLYRFTVIHPNFINAIVKIGVIEELSKLAALMIIYRLIENDFNEIVDGIIYITAISLGFSVIENIMYATHSPFPFKLLAFRSFFSVLGHLSFSGYMGIAYYIHKRIHGNLPGIIFAVILAALAHGLYDGVLFERMPEIIFLILFLSLIYLQFRLLKTALSFSKFRKTFTPELFVPVNQKNYYYCARCRKTGKGTLLAFHNISSYRCDICGNFVFDSGNISSLFKYFRPLVKFNHKFLKRFSARQKIISWDNDGKIIYSKNRLWLSAPGNELADWFDKNNFRDQKALMNRPVTGTILKLLGLRYLML